MVLTGLRVVSARLWRETITLMNHDLDEKLNFLRSHGAGTQRHSGGTLIAHLLGTRTLLKAWGARPALCDAGLFHSVYGTESYGAGIIVLELRPAVRDIIGKEAEALAFLFGIKKSAAFYPMANVAAAALELGEGAGRTATSKLCIEHRLTSERLLISRQQLGDLINLTVANALEQAYRSRLNLDARECEFLMGLSPLALPRAVRATRHACRHLSSS